ncbi:MAG: membrane dipeptidase [Clostridia bacterium]|nr:membrane dipeptidase [Clostridia bacterium]MBP3650433.1 membrane dipeptidase [Clostridia bacterium]
MLICDTHADTLWALQNPKRATDTPTDITLAHLTAPGDTRVQAMALFVGGNGLTGEDHDLIQRELCQLDQLKAQGFRQIHHISEALPGQANILLTIEGGEAFGESSATVASYAALGVRAAALVWNNENRLAHPAKGGSSEGLTPFGKTILQEMRKHRMAVDISHLNERGSDEVMDSDTPCMASHSCARGLCDHFRNLSDRQLRQLFATGGYVGVNFFVPFLATNGKATLDTVIDHMAYMCDMGGENHVGLGSDFDGIDQYPEGLRNAGDIPALLERMRQRGFSEALVEKIAGQNFAAYLDRIEY